MVLGYGGFLGLNDEKYQKKLRNASTEDLKTQEIAKTRRQVACGMTVGSGIGTAVFTFGASLAFSAIAARKWRVTDRKLKMIQDELQRRHIKLHEKDWKDLCIPGAAFIIGEAVGVTIDQGIGATVVEVDYGTATQEMASQPQEATQDFSAGMVAQTNQVVSSDGTTQIAGPGTATSGSAAYHLGADTAQNLQTSAANLAALQTTWWIAEYFEDLDEASPTTIGCNRCLGTIGFVCNGCLKSITSGSYMHCCRCVDNNFDLCTDCYNKGNRCSCSTQTLKHLQRVL